MHTLFFDGCSKGNPGRSGAGAVIYDADGEELWSASWFVGDSATNNIAEYTGLIRGLEEAVNMGMDQLSVKGDSQLVIKQMKGEYKVKSDSMYKLFAEAKRLEKKIGYVIYSHVYRSDNARADGLSNDGLFA
tara:strand:- start:372 stop:767 length:396 start_codon:yes stop_codon:yes gene_type:complete